MGKTRLSMAFDDVSGSCGDSTVAQTRAGLATRSKPKYRYPKVAAVQAGNARLSAANAAWNEMSVEQAESWNRFAESLPLKTGFSGDRYRTTGKNVLVAYASKLLQIDPGATIPLDPPVDRYKAPDLSVQLSAQVGLLVFSPSAPIPSGTLIEIMVQPLANGKRKPGKFYKSAGFEAFSEAGNAVAIPVKAGWYACAWQFVEASTGRTAWWMPLGKVEVV